MAKEGELNLLYLFNMNDGGNAKKGGKLGSPPPKDASFLWILTAQDSKIAFTPKAIII